jgi:AAA15 family ATPase/GTPase
VNITSITISNYRGISQEQIVPLDRFSSFVGKNDAGKSIILNAIASFLDPKSNPLTITDFNDLANPVTVECCFVSDSIKETIEAKVKTKIKKADGLDEFLDDLLVNGKLVVRKACSSPRKDFDSEKILFRDYVDEDFQYLYSKSDEELNQIITQYAVTLPVEGKGRNSKLEKIKYIKQYCETNGIQKCEKYIDDTFKISSLLPAVELFRADYGLEADTRCRTSSVSEILEYFEKESAEGEKLALVASEISDEMKKEADSVKTYMSEYVSNLLEVEIKPSISWKDAIKSVDVSFQFEGDSKPIPMSHKGTGYRRLFMVARFRYLAEKNKGLNVIYLIEEPETFLHPSAQNDLLNALRELSDDNQVIITTHSPVFAGATHAESVILCKKGNGSEYENYTTAGREVFLSSIVAELGIKPSYNLRDTHEKILFVESHNDARFYHLICQQLSLGTLLGNDRLLVLPFGGGEDIDSFLNIDYFDRSGRELFLLIDSDKHTGNHQKQAERAQLFEANKERGSAYVINKSCIENYYHPRAFERTYGLAANSFPELSAEVNVRTEIKQYKACHAPQVNIKEKNNFDVFDQMTSQEWEHVVEQELIDFLAKVLDLP